MEEKVIIKEKTFVNIVFVSLLRVASMFLIVLYHCLCFYAGIWWYMRTEVVPLWRFLAYPIVETGLTTFVFISGFLYGYLYCHKGKYRNSIQFWEAKIKRLIIPYIFWGCIWILIMPEKCGSWPNLFTGIGHLWFLLALFDIFFIVFILIKIGVIKCSTDIWNKCIDIIILMISFSLVYLWSYYSNHHYIFAFELALFYLPMFVSGFFYAKYGIYMNNYSKINYIVLIIGIMSLFLLSYFNIPTNSTLYRLPSIVIVCCLVYLLCDIKQNPIVAKFVSAMDSKSMGIYIFNQFIVFAMLFIPLVNSFLCSHSYIGPFCIFVVSYIIPWILSVLFSKYKILSWTIGQYQRRINTIKTSLFAENNAKEW